MQGRLENKLKTEKTISEKVKQMPSYMERFLLSIRSKEHTTRLRYVNNVSRFLLHYNNGIYPAIEDLRKIDSFAIQEFMSDIQYYQDDDGNIKELKETSQCVIYSSLSTFFMFLTRSGYIEINPFDNKMIERPKIHETEVVYLTPEEVRKVEYNIVHQGTERQRKWKYRDYLLFRIPVINGLRVTALSEINVDDIDMDNHRIKVIEKGNISKYVGFDEMTGRYLSMWLTERGKLLGKEKCNALFISNRRTRMTTSSIERVIMKYTECIDGKHITPHKLRATCGTNIYQQTKDIYLVSKVLGHKNTVPTKRYAAVLNEDIADAVNSVAKLYS